MLLDFAVLEVEDGRTLKVVTPVWAVLLDIEAFELDDGLITEVTTLV